MSTYTDLHLRKKENLTILRMPGNPYDGMTPQRVIFANPENIYNGRFIGQLSTTSVTFDNVTMTNCSVIGGVLSDVAFKIGTSSEIMLTDLTSDISQMSGDVEDLLDFQVSVNASCDSFSTNIGFLSNHISTLQTSATWLSGYADALSNALTSISGNSGNMSSYISDEICALASVDNSLCTSISGLSNELSNLSVEANRRIDDIQIQVAGGLVYKGSLSIDLFATTSEFPLSSLFWSNGIAADASLSTGWLFIAQTQPNNKENHYVYGGVTLEHGDWLIVKHDSIVSNITSADVDVFDAQDYDTFKLSEDNAATGSNIFAGRTSFTSSAIFNGDVSLNGNTSVNGNIAFYSPSVEFLNDVTIDKNLITRYLESNNAEFKNLSINLGETKYKGGLCSLQDLSDEIYTTLSTHSQNISSIDDQLLSINNKISAYDTELSNHMRYYGSFTDYRYENISTFLDANLNLLSDSIIENGSMFRFNQIMTLSDATSSIAFFENDYIVCNKDVKLGHIQLSDFDFIRDAEAEVKQLSNDIYVIQEDLSSLDAKQDKLTDDQIFAIDTSVNDKQTLLNFGNNDISIINLSGNITRQTLIDIGIANDRFSWKKEPYSIKFGNAILSIDDYAFGGCFNNLSSVIFNKNLQYIGIQAFENCTLLSNIEIPNNVAKIDRQAFSNCNNLTNVIIPYSVLDIGNSAFSQCSKLSSILIPNSVTAINDAAFSDCISLISILIPNNIIAIGDRVFHNSNNLTSIIVEGKTQEEAEILLSNAGLPNNCKIITYARNTDVISKDELKQTLSSIASDSALISLTLTSNFENIVSSVVKVRDILSSLYETLN